HTGLGVVGLLGRHQVVEVAVEMRDRQQGQHPRDRLVLGLLSDRPHYAVVAGRPDTGAVRPTKNPAVISSSDTEYTHQIGTASAALPSTNLLMPIIASETANATPPSAVHGVGNRASSAAHTIAPSTAMYSVTGTAMP